MSEQVVQSQKFNLTPSVEGVLKHVGLDQLVSTTALAQAVLQHHSEYGGGRVKSLSLADTPTERTAMEWLDEVLSLFDAERMQSFSEAAASETESVSAPEPPRLHGRLFVIGLALLEPRLREQLESAGVFSALVEEIIIGQPKA